MSSRRTIRSGTYSVPPYVILTYRQEPGWWYVTAPTTRRCSMRHMNALGHCMRKALSIVWGVWCNGRDFDPNWGGEA